MKPAAATFTLTVNGAARTVVADPWTRLLDVLRSELALTGTKEGCGEGECGACTVLLDDVPVNSCLVAIGQCGGRAVTTVEGLAGSGPAPILSAVQRELVARGGAQCGICTPGIAVCASYVVRNRLAMGPPGQARAKVRELLAGNICRCTGYQLIVDAVVAAARAEAGDDGGDA